MGNRTSTTSNLRRNKTTSALNIRGSIPIPGKTEQNVRPWSNGLTPPGAVCDDSFQPKRRVRKPTSLQAVVRDPHTALNEPSAYASARLLHAPRLRLNSSTDGDGPTLRERRNSILLDNLENMQLVMNMDDISLEILGDSCGIYQPSTKASRCGKIGHRRRNSSNSIFLTQTADNILDHKALVKCIAAAVHASVADVPGRVTKQYRIFIDPDAKFFCRPLYEDVLRFVNNIFLKAQLEAEVLIISLIYFERLLLIMNSEVIVGYRNWRAILLACCVLASKVWDDLSMINADFSTITANRFTLQQINKLEIALLAALKFDVKVSLSMFAMYYFKLRAMLGPGALFHDMAELSIRNAQKIQALSSSFSKRLSIRNDNRRRTYTIGTNEDRGAQQVSTASLEHIIRQEGRSGKAREQYQYQYQYQLRRSAEAHEQRKTSIDAPRKPAVDTQVHASTANSRKDIPDGSDQQLTDAKYATSPPIDTGPKVSLRNALGNDANGVNRCGNVEVDQAKQQLSGRRRRRSGRVRQPEIGVTDEEENETLSESGNAELLDEQLMFASNGNLEL